MGIRDFFRRLFKAGTADGTREAMRQSYERHYEEIQADRMSVPPGTTPHEAALYGMLASRYMTYSGVSGDTIQGLEPLIWAELVPFVALPDDEGIEAVAEYVVWKEEETRADARLEWLRGQVEEGVDLARAQGRGEDVEAARNLGDGHRAPWVGLIE